MHRKRGFFHREKKTFDSEKSLSYFRFSFLLSARRQRRHIKQRSKSDSTAILKSTLMDHFTPLPWDLDFDTQDYVSAALDDFFNDFTSTVVPPSQRETSVFDPNHDDPIDSLLADRSHECELMYDPQWDDGILAYLRRQSIVTPLPSKSSTQTVLSSLTSEPYPLRSSWMVFDKTIGRERRPLLYEFLQLLLDDANYASVAEYIDRPRGIFKFHKPKEVARLWKEVKGRNSDASEIRRDCCGTSLSFSLL